MCAPSHYKAQAEVESAMCRRSIVWVVGPVCECFQVWPSFAGVFLEKLWSASFYTSLQWTRIRWNSYLWTTDRTRLYLSVLQSNVTPFTWSLICDQVVAAHIVLILAFSSGCGIGLCLLELWSRKVFALCRCYCLLHEQDIMGAILKHRKDLRMAASLEEVEEKLWAVLNEWETEFTTMDI